LSVTVLERLETLRYALPNLRELSPTQRPKAVKAIATIVMASHWGDHLHTLR